MRLLQYGTKTNTPVHIYGEQGTFKSVFVENMQKLASKKGIKLKLTEPESYFEDVPCPDDPITIGEYYGPSNFTGVLVKTVDIDERNKDIPVNRNIFIEELFEKNEEFICDFFSLHKR